MNTVFSPQPQIVLPVSGLASVFPVHRVYCVGHNYTSYATVTSNGSIQEPFFSTKPTNSLVPEGGDIAYPAMTCDLQHEIELVVALCEGGENISPSKAMACVFGYAAGLDLTRRDLLAQARGKGHPWDMSKAFNQSAPISAILPLEKCGSLRATSIWLKVNGELRQDDSLSNMLWEIPEIISNLSAYVCLKPGDLIFTGTPAGASALFRGDHVVGGIEGVGEISIRVV